MSTLTSNEIGHTFTAMASTITVRVIDPTAEAAAAIEMVEQTFRDVERACTRFDPSSDLMRANARPDEWTVVAPECFEALRLAHAAHVHTSGAFDPRVLRTLTSLGYDRSLGFAKGNVVTDGRIEKHAFAEWTPEFDVATSGVRLGADPIDLGGIGKGYAVRRGIGVLAGVGRAALVEAGGDLATYGCGPDRHPGEARAWRAAVEDPHGGDAPIAILDVSDMAAATSSLRLRRWLASGREVHHIIDPRTSAPSTSDLVAVTVIAADPAWAEIWTKACFLEGSAGVDALVERESLAAYWVDAQGHARASAAMRGRILWEAS
ncbi:MAG: FAD:protein FMN transferase [Candidatus Nanopelagicales bacterium]|nr:FAD:protein FMN transferase [Candidatus Nanopelagicales bacterium]MDP5094473.1 FAD:protein FMN transferase [Candidatus Nanopelagicales bacterium]